jgi:hypothetical protein
VHVSVSTSGPPVIVAAYEAGDATRRIASATRIPLLGNVRRNRHFVIIFLPDLPFDPSTCAQLQSTRMRADSAEDRCTFCDRRFVRVNIRRATTTWNSTMLSRRGTCNGTRYIFRAGT